MANFNCLCCQVRNVTAAATEAVGERLAICASSVSLLLSIKTTVYQYKTTTWCCLYQHVCGYVDQDRLHGLLIRPFLLSLFLFFFHFSSLVALPRRLCFRRCLSVCLFVCLLATLH